MLEVDVWDGDDENGPVVTHGHTLCGKLLLQTALLAIKEVAFLNSQYVPSLRFSSIYHEGFKSRQDSWKAF